MTIPMSKAPVAFTPDWLCADDGAAKPGAIVLQLRPGGFIEREQFEAELASPPWNAARVWSYELFDELVAAVRAWLSGDDLARVVELVELGRMNLLEGDRQGAAVVEQLEQSCLSSPGGWPAYQALHGRRVRRNQFLPMLAARRFVVGWSDATDQDGEPLAFALGSDGLVADEALGRLPQAVMRAAGIAAYALLRGEKARPFSVSPSPSSAAPPTSPSAVRRRPARAGKSTGPSTRKTPS